MNGNMFFSANFNQTTTIHFHWKMTTFRMPLKHPLQYKLMFLILGWVETNIERACTAGDQM
jgi:hypothetical protein